MSTTTAVNYTWRWLGRVHTLHNIVYFITNDPIFSTRLLNITAVQEQQNISKRQPIYLTDSSPLYTTVLCTQSLGSSFEKFIG